MNRRMTRRGRKAFTLVELMIVIAVMSILLAMGFFSFRDSRTKRSFDGEVEECIAAIQDTANLGKSCRFLEINNEIIKDRSEATATGDGGKLQRGDNDPGVITWSIWKNGRRVRSGSIGKDYSNGLIVEGGPFSDIATKGEDVQQGAAFELSKGNDSFCVIYLPDGSPLRGGDINFTLQSGSKEMRKITAVINYSGRVVTRNQQ